MSVLHLSRLNLGLGKRVRHTCVACSRDLLAVGASTGSVYFYSRSKLSFMQMVACAGRPGASPSPGLAPIAKVAFSPAEPELFAVARADGLVMVYHGKFRELTSKALWLCTIDHHTAEGSPPPRVSSLVWGPNGRWLFSGDSTGRVARTYIWPDMATGTPNPEIETWGLLGADRGADRVAERGGEGGAERGGGNVDKESHVARSSLAPIVQMAARVLSGGQAASVTNPGTADAKHLPASPTGSPTGSPTVSPTAQLLVSTTTRALLVDVSDPNDLQPPIIQVGKKLRNGYFGACFHPRDVDTLLAVRPGKRLWTARTASGQVLKTLKMRISGVSFQFRPFSTPEPLDPSNNALHTPEALKSRIQFGMITRLDATRVVTWGGLSPSMCVVDVEKGVIEAWHTDLGHVLDTAVPPLASPNEFFVLQTPDPRSVPADVARIRVVPATAAVQQLLRERYTHGLGSGGVSGAQTTLACCAALCVHHGVKDPGLLAALRDAMRKSALAGDPVALTKHLEDQLGKILSSVPGDTPVPSLATAPRPQNEPVVAAINTATNTAINTAANSPRRPDLAAAGAAHAKTDPLSFPAPEFESGVQKALQKPPRRRKNLRAARRPSRRKKIGAWERISTDTKDKNKASTVAKPLKKAKTIASDSTKRRIKGPLPPRRRASAVPRLQQASLGRKNRRLRARRASGIPLRPRGVGLAPAVSLGIDSKLDLKTAIAEAAVAGGEAKVPPAYLDSSNEGPEAILTAGSLVEREDSGVFVTFGGETDQLDQGSGGSNTDGSDAKKSRKPVPSWARLVESVEDAHARVATLQRDINTAANSASSEDKYAFVSKAAPLLETWVARFKLAMLGGDAEADAAAVACYRPDVARMAAALLLLYFDCRASIMSSSRDSEQAQAPLVAIITQFRHYIPITRLFRLLSVHRLQHVIRALPEALSAVSAAHLERVEAAISAGDAAKAAAAALYKPRSDEPPLCVEPSHLIMAKFSSELIHLCGSLAVDSFADAYPVLPPWLTETAVREAAVRETTGQESRDSAGNICSKGRYLLRYFTRLMLQRPQSRRIPSCVEAWVLAALGASRPSGPGQLFTSCSPPVSVPGDGPVPVPTTLPLHGSPLASDKDTQSCRAALRFGLRRADPVGGLLRRMLSGWRPRPWGSAGSMAGAAWSDARKIALSVTAQPDVFKFDADSLALKMLKVGFFEGVVAAVLARAGQANAEHIAQSDSKNASPLAATAVYLCVCGGRRRQLRTLLYRVVGRSRRLWIFTLRIIFCLTQVRVSAGNDSKDETAQDPCFALRGDDADDGISSAVACRPKACMNLPDAALEMARILGSKAAIDILNEALGSARGLDRAIAAGSGCVGTAGFYRVLLEIECLRKQRDSVARDITALLEASRQAGDIEELFKKAASRQALAKGR